MPSDELERVLCRIEEIPDGAARGFLREGNDDRVFAVRQGESVFAYVNSCPHNWRPLEYRPNQFLSTHGEHIVCYAHGARFRIADGYCFSGPCAGRSLIPISSRIDRGRVLIPADLPAIRADLSAG